MFFIYKVILYLTAMMRIAGLNTTNRVILLVKTIFSAFQGIDYFENHDFILLDIVAICTDAETGHA